MSIEADAGEAAPEAEAPANKSRKLLYIAACAAAALAIGGGAAAFLMMSGPGEAEAPVAAPAYFYDLPQIMVNLSGAGDGGEQFLRLAIALELPDQGSVALIEQRMPLVIDAFTVYLRELRRSDLEGSAGVYRLKEELRRRLNLAIHPARVDNILFKEMLVQ